MNNDQILFLANYIIMIYQTNQSKNDAEIRGTFEEIGTTEEDTKITAKNDARQLIIRYFLLGAIESLLKIIQNSIDT